MPNIVLHIDSDSEDDDNRNIDTGAKKVAAFTTVKSLLDNLVKTVNTHSEDNTDKFISNKNGEPMKNNNNSNNLQTVFRSYKNCNFDSTQFNSTNNSVGEKGNDNDDDGEDINDDEGSNDDRNDHQFNEKYHNMIDALNDTTYNEDKIITYGDKI